MAELTKIKQLDFLDKLKPNEVASVPVSNEGIGGELLNILSKGLYTNPLDAIREYVQNSIDANAEQVEIQITGNSVFILDYGDGMSRDALLQARDFGVSAKSIEENVGFRGIGIYSGFDLCERLVIRTKTVLDDNEHVLEFNYGDMRRKLDVARQDPERPVIPLTSLLEEHTSYYFVPSTRRAKSFTLVQLEDLSDNHIHRLSDVEEMSSYILRNLPIRYSSEFEHAQAIEQSLRKNVPGYKSSRVVLKIEDEPIIMVEKPNISQLKPPVMGYIYDSKGTKELAFYWACLTSVSKALSARGFAEFAGLVYKIKGFTIGDADNLRHHFTRKQMYVWWTGEIYVIDPEVIPTSARDDFEAGPAKDTLEAAVREVLNGARNKHSLQKIALEAQATRRADEIVKNCQIKLETIETQISSSEFDRLKTYSELDNIIQDLKDKKGKASDKTKASNLHRKAQNLQKSVKKLLEQPTPISARKREAAKTALEEGKKQETLGFESEDESEDEASAELKAESQEDQPEQEAFQESEESPQKGLMQIVSESGWILDAGLKELISLIGEAIDDNLGTDSKVYMQLMSDIEERLTDYLEAS